MDEIERLEHERLKQQRQVEQRFYFIRILLVLTTAVITGLAVIYNVRKDNDHTRDYIKCVINTIYTVRPEEAKLAITKCTY